MRRMEIMPTGSATQNQTIQVGGGFMISMAIMFCGEAIGESIPPTFEASAMPRIRALDIGESEGRLRSIGYKSQLKGPNRELGLYLNDGETQYRCCYITDPHAGKGCHEHVRDENSARFCASLAQDKSGNSLCDVVFR